MSIITFKISEDKVKVAFDGRCLINNDQIETESFIKAYKINNSIIIGATGIADSVKMFKKFAEENVSEFEELDNTLDGLSLMKEFKEFIIEEYNVSEDMFKDFGGFLIINKLYHGVFYFDDGMAPFVTKEYEDSGAFGSTGTYTKALMDAGITMENAIKMSAKKYNSINDNVTTLEIEK